MTKDNWLLSKLICGFEEKNWFYIIYLFFLPAFKFKNVAHHWDPGLL